MRRILAVSMICAAACGGSTSSTPLAVAQVIVTGSSGAAVQLGALGASVQLTARALDSNGADVSGAAFTWASSASGVASVDANGLVTAVSDGDASILASSGGVSGSIAVHVAQSAAAITIAPSSGSIERGATVQLSAMASDANGHPVDASSIS